MCCHSAGALVTYRGGRGGQHGLASMRTVRGSNKCQRHFSTSLLAVCRSSSSLSDNDSVSVAASALWRLPLVYIVLNIIRIFAITGMLTCITYELKL